VSGAIIGGHHRGVGILAAIATGHIAPASVIAVLMLVACQDSSTRRRGDGTRTPPRASDFLRLDTVRVVQHERLWQVQTVRFFDDRLVVLNAGSNEVFEFDPSGRLAAAFGRPGQGPGEFGHVRDGWVRGDSVYVLDSLSRRLSMFAAGELARDWSLAAFHDWVERVRVLDDGTVVIGNVRRALGLGAPPGPNFFTDTIDFHALARGSETAWRRMFSIPAGERSVRFIAPGAPSVMIPAWASEVWYELTSDGVIAVENRSGRIGMWTWSGDSILIRAGPSAATYVSDAELKIWEEAIQVRARTMPDPAVFLAGARAGIERWRGRIPRPVFEDLKSDGATIAVQEYELGREHPGVWQILDRAGELHGKFVLPANMRLLTLEGDRLAVVARDSVDVESILVLRMRRDNRQ
jgi:hypothetical protein